jgi:hypothetical protein
MPKSNEKDRMKVFMFGIVVETRDQRSMHCCCIMAPVAEYNGSSAAGYLLILEMEGGEDNGREPKCECYGDL